MDEEALFQSVGGIAAVQANGDPNDPADRLWNFGIDRMTPRPAMTSFADAAPEQTGKWDGKTSISLWQVFRKVTGKPLRAQYQVDGMCVGRGCSGAGNVLQACLIASGAALEYKALSHSWLYGGARKRAGMLNDWQAGAVGAYAALWGQEKGVLHQEEAVDPKSGKADTNYYGKGSDDIAKQWGYYGPPASLLPIAADNPFQEVAKCNSAQQAADTIASMGVVTIASNQGFSMTRDGSGVCKAKGSWAHQMYLAAIIALPDGRKVFGCGQSWGENVPDGPLLDGCENYVFGIEFDVADRMLKQNDSQSIGAFAGWPGNIDNGYGLI